MVFGWQVIQAAEAMSRKGLKKIPWRANPALFDSKRQSDGRDFPRIAEVLDLGRTLALVGWFIHETMPPRYNVS